MDFTGTSTLFRFVVDVGADVGVWLQALRAAELAIEPASRSTLDVALP